jgi:hypothetical protein
MDVREWILALEKLATLFCWGTRETFWDHPIVSWRTAHLQTFVFQPGMVTKLRVPERNYLLNAIEGMLG